MPIDVLLIAETRIATVQLLEQLLAHLNDTTDVRARSRLLHELQPEDFTADTYPVIARSVDPEAYAIARMLRGQGVPYGYYIDDNFWLLDPATDVGRHYAEPSHRRRLAWVVRNASTVIASTPLLREYLRPRNPNVIQLDSFFDFSLVPQLPSASKGRHRVRGGFAASVDRIQDVKPVIADVLDVLDEHESLEFEFIGVDAADVPRHPRIRTFPYQSSYAEYIGFQRSRRWDFGLAPLGPTKSNLYKTDNKYREYAAQGIPGIYEDAPPYARVRDGETGLLAGRDRSWRDAMGIYLEDPALRARVRVVARADAERHSALENVAPQWAAFFATVTPRRSLEQTARLQRAFARQQSSLARAVRRSAVLWDFGKLQVAETGLLPSMVRTARFVGKRLMRR